MLRWPASLAITGESTTEDIRMKKSKYIRLYEALCPEDLLKDYDPRISAIIAEMKAVVGTDDIAVAAKAIDWYGWNSSLERNNFIRRAWKIWDTL